MGDLDSVAGLRRIVKIAKLDTHGPGNSIAGARTLGYLADVGADLLKTGEIEDRVAALEGVLRPRAPAGAAR